MDALSQILAALSVKSYTATGVRGGGFSIAYPAYPGMKLLVSRKGKMYFLKKRAQHPIQRCVMPGMHLPVLQPCLKLKARLTG